MPELSPITRLYRECDPLESLKPDDPRYVDCTEARGEDAVLKLARGLRRSDPNKAEIRLFAGHRGIGKTSELYRLRAELTRPENSSPPFLVLYCTVEEQLDTNDLDFPDLLVFLAGETIKGLRDANIAGFTASSTYLKSVWDGLKATLGSEVTVSEVEVDTGFGSLTAQLRSRPNARSILRQKIEAQASQLLFAVNDLLSEARTALRNDGKQGLVLLVDGLDKVVRRQLPDGINTHDRLFVHRSEQMASLQAHIVYTVPISFLYSPEAQQLKMNTGDLCTVLPMIRLRPTGKGEIHNATPGIMAMREIIDARSRKAKIKLSNAFDSDDTMMHLCRMTGGHPSHLLTFLCAAMDELDNLPITRRALDKAIQRYANSLLREVPDEAWEQLRKFNEPQETIPKDGLHQQSLLLLHIFEYMNGQQWYEVSPVLRTLAKFTSGR